MATHAQIRAHLGHGEGSRKVRISRDGIVTYSGSRSDTDRSHDYWHEAGTVESVSREIEQTRAAGRPPEMDEGRPVRVYLDAASIATAKRLGDGNVSAGIRAALARK
jgi:hypothetical protein